jgi:Rrf2 family protein
MRVSQRLDYALRAIVLLSAQPAGEYVAAGELAERLLLPRRFVEQQVTALSRAGIVESRRGSNGGVALARAAREITVLEVVLALEGSVVDVPRHAGSAVAEMWRTIADMTVDRLAEYTIADLCERQRELDARDAPTYSI